MKNLKMSVAAMLLMAVSLGYSQETAKKGHDHSKMEMSGMQNDKMMNRDQKTSKATAVLNSYLELKNALVADNSEKAATAGKKLFDAFTQFDQSSIAEAQKQEVIDIIEDAREHAEHISENSGKMDHQREHFDILSNDIKDLIAITGTDRVLYKTFCPMYNNNKGAIWLSETKEIKNPYLGSKMSTCGEIQEEIK